MLKIRVMVNFCSKVFLRIELCFWYRHHLNTDRKALRFLVPFSLIFSDTRQWLLWCLLNRIWLHYFIATSAPLYPTWRLDLKLLVQQTGREVIAGGEGMEQRWQLFYWQKFSSRVQNRCLSKGRIPGNAHELPNIYPL